jgi:hypothetical protein
MNKKRTKKQAMQTRLMKAEKPTKNVANGFTDVDILAQLPSHIIR